MNVLGLLRRSRELILLIVLVGLIVLIGLISFSRNRSSGPDMDTYTFKPNVEDLTGTEWHPGDLLPVKWDVVGDSMSQSVPKPISLIVSILGPANTITEAKSLSSQHEKPMSTKKMIVTDQTGMLEPEQIQMPLNFTPGTYGVAEYVEIDGHRVREAVTVIKIVK